MILNFYFDKDDPEELKACDELKKSRDIMLRASKLGRYDDYSYDVKGQCLKINTCGNDAEAMLDALVNVMKNDAFLIELKAT